jgi:hypothetical protein
VMDNSMAIVNRARRKGLGNVRKAIYQHTRKEGYASRLKNSRDAKPSS